MTDFSDRALRPHDTQSDRERRIAALLTHLPRWARDTVVRLRRPEMRVARITTGIAFCFGGCLFFLPVLGLWMLPLGLILLSDDVPPLRALTDRGLVWAERRWPRLFANG
jgi:hypothetical protein